MSTVPQTGTEGQEPPLLRGGDRFKIALATALVAAVLRVLAITWRISSSFAPGAEGEPRPGERRIFCFWHRALIPAVWCFRSRGIAVMTSRSRDGEYISQLIERFGFRAVRGSSSRGGAAALLAMRRELEAGGQAAFTPDGPRGPRYQAKPGPVVLARSTGIPIHCFYVACDRAWQLKSWDTMLIPKPFARVHYHFESGIAVSDDGAGLPAVQAALEQAQRGAEEALG
jgi:lysophospholipid acyltransferase (LPLAT)-like uncharacterized protein